jgi:isoamylase
VVLEWQLLADSARGLIEPNETPIGHGAVVTLSGRSVLLYEARTA